MSALSVRRRLAELQHECVRLAAVEMALGAVVRAQRAELTRRAALVPQPAGRSARLLRRLERQSEPHMNGQVFERQAGAAVEPALVEKEVAGGGAAAADEQQGGSSCDPSRLRREDRAGGER